MTFYCNHLTAGLLVVMLRKQVLQSFLKFSWVLRDHRSSLWSLAFIFFSQSAFKTKKAHKKKTVGKRNLAGLLTPFLCDTHLAVCTCHSSLCNRFLNVLDLGLKLTCCFCCRCFWFIILIYLFHSISILKSCLLTYSLFTSRPKFLFFVFDSQLPKKYHTENWSKSNNITFYCYQSNILKCTIAFHEDSAQLLIVTDLAMMFTSSLEDSREKKRNVERSTREILIAC